MKNKTKMFAVIASVLVLVGAVIPTTLAFLIDVSQQITNVFQDSSVTSQVNEASFDGNTKTGVTIQNTGDTEAWIRAAIIVTWKDDENGNVFGAVPVKGVDYTIEFGAGWIEGEDGFYYYKDPVAGGLSTTDLITTCSPESGRTPEGYGLNVEILSSAIQSKPANAFAKWEAKGVKLNSDGTAIVEG